MDELTNLQADELLEQIAELQVQIKAAEDERDEFIAHYQAKIERARDICAKATIEPRREIEVLTEALRRYAEANLSEGRKSIRLPSGTLSFHRQYPKYFIDGRAANAQSPALLTFAKANAPEYVKVTEYVDWSGLKRHLQETGEYVEGLEVQEFPDAFTVKVG